MSKYEAAFPKTFPTQALVDVAKGVSSGAFGGGKVALPAWVATGYGLSTLFGTGEDLIVGAAAPAESSAFLPHDLREVSAADRAAVEAAYVEAFGELPAEAKQMTVDGKAVAGSMLSVWLRLVVYPLVTKAMEMLLAMFNKPTA